MTVGTPSPDTPVDPMTPLSKDAKGKGFDPLKMAFNVAVGAKAGLLAWWIGSPFLGIVVAPAVTQLVSGTNLYERFKKAAKTLGSDPEKPKGPSSGAGASPGEVDVPAPA